MIVNKEFYKELNEMIYTVIIDGMDSEVVIRLKKRRAIELRDKLNNIIDIND